MSTRSVTGWIGTSLAVALVATAVHAGVVFSPSLRFGASRSENVGYLGQNDPDAVFSLSANLNLQANRPGTTLSVGYQPAITAYGNTSDNNNIGHRLDFNLGHEISSRSRLSFRLAGTQSERQGFAPNDPSAPVTLVSRTRTDRYTTALSGSIQRESRSSWNWRVGAGVIRYESSGLRGSETYNAGFAWMRKATQRTSLGLDYGFSLLSVDQASDGKVHSLQFVGSQAFAKNVSGTFAVGASRAQSLGNDPTLISFTLGVSKPVSKGTSFTVGASQNLSAGGGTSTATRDLGAFMQWRFSPTPRTGFQLGLSYWDRPAISGPAGTEALITRESFIWSPGKRHFGYGFYHSYYDQSGQDSLGGSLETEFHSYGLFAQWTPKPVQ